MGTLKFGQVSVSYTISPKSTEFDKTGKEKNARKRVETKGSGLSLVSETMGSGPFLATRQWVRTFLSIKNNGVVTFLGYPKFFQPRGPQSWYEKRALTAGHRRATYVQNWAVDLKVASIKHIIQSHCAIYCLQNT